MSDARATGVTRQFDLLLSTLALTAGDVPEDATEAQILAQVEAAGSAATPRVLRVAIQSDEHGCLDIRTNGGIDARQVVDLLAATVARIARDVDRHEPLEGR